ncbi:hypothetical protein [Roseospira navarrensis]
MSVCSIPRGAGPAGALLLASAVAVAVAVAAAGAAPPARAAESGETLRYGHTGAPFWEVGNPDADLSRLCRQGRFNQKKNTSYYIGYHGRANPGRGYTGIAKRGYNLIDPTGQAVDGVTYHFFNDGFSNCKVYVAEDPLPEGEAAGGRP